MLSFHFLLIGGSCAKSNVRQALQALPGQLHSLSMPLGLTTSLDLDLFFVDKSLLRGLCIWFIRLRYFSIRGAQRHLYGRDKLK